MLRTILPAGRQAMQPPSSPKFGSDTLYEVANC